MTTLNCDKLQETNNPQDDAVLSPPGWVRSLVGIGAVSNIEVGDRVELALHSGKDASLVSVRHRDALVASAAVLEQQTVAIYQKIRETLAAGPHPYPVRLWNFLPAIHQQLDAHRDRYMVFNSGRFNAYCRWWGGAGELSRNVPTASGVGHHGRDLVIHCLASGKPGIAIENPRQIPALGYSRRYGPQPPCFARATLVGKSLLLGGTASICGEQSMHLNELEAQANETLTNVSAVVGEAARRSGARALNDEQALATLTSLRVYHPHPNDRDWIERTMQSRFAKLSNIEFLCADLCRPELLIEIEGVADLS